MKIPCAVIRDLLPLYAEDLASEESKQVVDEHLADCPDCRARLETLRQPAVPEHHTRTSRWLSISLRIRM